MASTTFTSDRVEYPTQEHGAPRLSLKGEESRNERVRFDPAKHLRFQMPEKTYTLDDLKYDTKQAVGHVAATDPFPLFSREAIIEMRRELLSERTIKNCMTYTRPGSVQIRGAAPQYAPFVYEAWTHPETIKAVSQVVGLPVKINIAQEIGHTNVQLGPDGLEGLKKLTPEPLEPKTSADAVQEEDITEDKDTDVIEWHNDMYPWSLVVSLSLPQGTGGETACLCGDGSIIKAPKPDVGYGVLLHGNVVKHKAVRAVGAEERITMVCSWWPADPLLYDDSKISHTRDVSYKPEMYYQWITYRLEVLAARCLEQAKKLHEKHENKKDYAEAVIEPQDFAAWAKEQIAFFERTYDHVK
ncbi:hypothetical protein LTR67_005598 [Exophiala xenobiotica]|nr:hypothetical protein H2202_007689 [Exophiala xenobiotica]KAK5209609.1 hypothetical protein LTR41_005145 [Exophiala xenobiotica]KAK5221679.1 hypothetical protein LTR47_010715 [Exophiala xenobiotica]KAK5223608.1 hypothetical protein LTR72_004994 [Exophiala xenobiotica]KAK5247332.1 hypothetical protein LTS06_007512 [Exophiala xenobiotica]